MTVLLRLSAGLIAWAVAFCAIYGLHGIGCARGWDATTVMGFSLQRAALMAAWVASLAATAALAVALSRRRETRLDRVSMATGWIGVAAVAVTFLPILAIPPCY